MYKVIFKLFMVTAMKEACQKVSEKQKNENTHM